MLCRRSSRLHRRSGLVRGASDPVSRPSQFFHSVGARLTGSAALRRGPCFRPAAVRARAGSQNTGQLARISLRSSFSPAAVRGYSARRSAPQILRFPRFWGGPAAAGGGLSHAFLSRPDVPLNEDPEIAVLMGGARDTHESRSESTSTLDTAQDLLSFATATPKPAGASPVVFARACAPSAAAAPERHFRLGRDARFAFRSACRSACRARLAPRQLRRLIEESATE